MNAAVKSGRYSKITATVFITDRFIVATIGFNRMKYQMGWFRDKISSRFLAILCDRDRVSNREEMPNVNTFVIDNESEVVLDQHLKHPIAGEVETMKSESTQQQDDEIRTSSTLVTSLNHGFERGRQDWGSIKSTK